jgi:predicted nicotinamide N-methyase
MCEFIGSYEDSKLLKRRMNKLAEDEVPKLEKVEEQPLVASK